MSARPLFADFTDVIAMADSYLEVERREPGEFVDGVYHKDETPCRFCITGSIQPATNEEIQRLPEGQRTREVFKLYTTHQLRVGDAKQEEEPDIVRWSGKRFEVSAEGAWKHLGNYYKYMLVGVAQ